MKVNVTKKIVVPTVVKARALAAGEIGQTWLENLSNIVVQLEKKWQIKVGKALKGGSHAFAAVALGKNGQEYVLKVDMPESLGHAEFERSIEALKIANGCGYAKLFAYDTETRACLLERLGAPLSELNYSSKEQMKIICETLKKSWAIPVETSKLGNAQDCGGWFSEFMGVTWLELGLPCSVLVIDVAYDYLRERANTYNPDNDVLVHGDAHNANILQDLSGGKNFKMVDPDGCLFERAYDLGVLMREWREEYRVNALINAKKRCKYLHKLTGVSKKSIWQWGYIQTVATGLLLMKTGREKLGENMLRIAADWCEGKDD